MKLKYLIIPIVTVLTVTSCELFEPVDDNHSTFTRVMNDPAFAEGILDYGYTKIPTNTFSYNDVATDDAVSNDKLNSYMRIATGEWSSSYDPMSKWADCLAGIQSVNQFLTIVDTIGWRRSIPELNQLWIKRFKGEAYGLRALLKYHLLVTVAGEDASGRLSGIPILDNYLDNSADFNIPRATFAQSVSSIYSDIDESLKYLTMLDYKTLTAGSVLPPSYESTTVSNYNVVFGNEAAQRISGRIVRALRAKTALLEASPAFADDAALWSKAAGYSGELLKTINGVAGLDPDGHRFFLKTLTDKVNLAAATPVDQKEMIWRTRKVLSNTRESANYPPLLFGSGRLNPTQNIVDAFPMQNGYPIDNQNSNYNSQQPYLNRDPRLALYVIYDGTKFKGSDIFTRAGGKENAKDSIPTSTRTGYYLKKLLVEQVNMTPASTSQEYHYEVHMRYTDLFLMYAEAANEAWGPDSDPEGFGFTARDVIRAIRKRAGIAQPDVYLNGINNAQDMRKLIRNERRLELCFEGHRFWDLRRWKENLNVTARGVEINKNATQYKYVDVEQRLYKDYMYSGPIPNGEVSKYSNLVQNKGW